MESKHVRENYHLWFLMAFIAGSVNAGGFLATGRFVSHTTGFATHFGVDIAHHRISEALSVLSVPFIFMLGSMVSGLFVDYRIHRGLKPQFDRIMILVFLCLIGATVFGIFEEHNILNERYFFKEDYVLLIFLSFSCGLQNAAITTYSGRAVRTTHLTGITTDIGLGFVRLWYFSKNSIEYKKEFIANLLRGGTIIAFILGSTIASVLFLKMNYYGFLIPAILSLCAMTLFRKQKNKF